MDIRLVVRGEVEAGTEWEFWREVPDALALPRVGDQVALGVGGGAAPHLLKREVVSVEWSLELDRVTVRLADLHAGWLQGNRTALADAGWITAVAGD